MVARGEQVFIVFRNAEKLFFKTEHEMVAFHPAFLFKEGFEALIQVFRCLCLPDCQMDMSEMRITKKCIEGMLSVDPFVYGGTATASVRDKLRLGSGVRFRIFCRLPGQTRAPLLLFPYLSSHGLRWREED